MDKVSQFIWRISQSKTLAQIAEMDPAAARLFDRTIRLLVTYGIGRGIDWLSHRVVDGQYSVAAILTAILYLRQARASKKYRDLENDDKIRKQNQPQV